MTYSDRRNLQTRMSKCATTKVISITLYATSKSNMNRMKILITATLTFFAFLKCTVTKLAPQQCDEFRSGSYVYNMYNESGLGHWTKLTYFITRNDSLKIVTSNHFPQDTSIYRITWTGTCEYKSLLLNPKFDFDSFLVRRNPTGTRHTIVKAADDYFIVKQFGRKDTLWKAK